MRALSLKPNHKRIGAYHASLADFAKLGVKHETAVRAAFQALLEDCTSLVNKGRADKWKLVPEYSLKGGEGHRRRPRQGDHEEIQARLPARQHPLPVAHPCRARAGWRAGARPRHLEARQSSSVAIMSCTYEFTDKTNGRRTPCPHPAFRTSNVCVFHSPQVGPKAAAFTTALGELLGNATASAEHVDLDFKGFVFPRADLRRYTFRGVADFRAAVFTDGVEFRSATFLQQADFHTTEFHGKTDFFSVVFVTSARFLGVNFRGRTIFSGSKFRGNVVFHGCKFFDFAAWQGSKFDNPVVFQSNELFKDADFRRATFYGGVDFTQTLFRRRVDFEGTRFHGEVMFSESHIGFLKKLSCGRANMDGAVLHTAQIWENERLSYYSFRGAFLLSVNLSGKELIDCDFTGAVFKAVLTVGWKPDRQTRHNTKFIYTDYRTQEVENESGGKRRVYSPVLESRVPADGNFGEGEHANFTFADYLREPLRMNIALSVPPLLRSAVTNYLQLFTDFLQAYPPNSEPGLKVPSCAWSFSHRQRRI